MVLFSALLHESYATSLRHNPPICSGDAACLILFSRRRLTTIRRHRHDVVVAQIRGVQSPVRFSLRCRDEIDRARPDLIGVRIEACQPDFLAESGSAMRSRAGSGVPSGVPIRLPGVAKSLRLAHDSMA